ncbi:MAG: hypothetical protein HWN66_01680 [Candidatus Helarchaeota archaeon]|nr:hypothetical protein [Candidatus Helarchaeota archaeon]
MDRIHALLQSFTAPTRRCPYYDKKIRSTCALDPRSRRAWDCQGVCFTDGYCCNRIVDKSAEIEELIKFLRFFPNKK